MRSLTNYYNIFKDKQKPREPKHIRARMQSDCERLALAPMTLGGELYEFLENEQHSCEVFRNSQRVSR